MNEPILIPIGGFEVPDVYLVTLGVTLLLGALAALSGRALKVEGFGLWQTAIEAFVAWIEGTVREVVDEDPAPYVPLIATLMVFIAVCNLLALIPVVRPPTAELSTGVALALVVFVAVPYYGIRRLGLWGYLRGYARPNPLLIPFNLLGEVTRTLALAVRLFGNVMSGVMIGAVILMIAGVLVPIPLLFLGILTGLIQAYIFGILTAVYIAAALQVGRRHPSEGPHD
ncbi:MAG: F0F1 ATP synthase subunit A [Planctomycetes bacterium]|nr:F0F1 ATP synthase subunit A [Planctomycetota bacterium]